MNSRCWLVLASTCVLGSDACALEYTVKALRHPNAGPTSGSKATSLNNWGQLCGDAMATNGAVTACIWDPDGSFVALPDIPGGADAAIGLSINASGTVAGYGTIGQVLNSAALWIDGQVTDLGTLPLHNKSSFALGINDSGAVVGRCARELDNRVLATAFLWQDGMMTPLAHLSETQSHSSASAVNSRGLIVGSSRNESALNQPVYWNGNQIWQLPQLPGAVGAGGAMDVNDSGAICGYSTKPGFIGAAVIWLGGQPMEIGLPGESCIGEAINNLDQVVGWSSSAGRPDDGWVWSGSAGAINLRTLSRSVDGWMDINAYDINDKGQVCGEAFVPNPFGGGYHREGFLLTPVSTMVAPSTFSVVYGQKQNGTVASLATVDGDALRICRFLVPNQQTDPVQIRVEASLPWQPMNLWFKATAKAASAGAFTWSLNLYDWTTGFYDPATNSTGSLFMAFSSLETIAKGDISRYVRTSDRKVWALVRARAVGPTASLAWCVDVDQAVWEAVPLP